MMESKEQDTPDMLYHYTSMEGLLGIIENKEIWATNIFYLNDSAEYEYAANLILQEIDSWIEAYSVRNNLSSLLGTFGTPKDTHPPRQTLADLIRHPKPKIMGKEKLSRDQKIVSKIFLKVLKKYVENIRHYHVYISSFTTEGDQLSQWRGYCPSGNCFSIGFKGEDLELKMDVKSFKLIKCIYKKDKQIKFIRDGCSAIVKDHLDIILKDFIEEGSLETVDEDSLLEIISSGAAESNKKMAELMPYLKHSSFKEENEWRFVYHSKEVAPLNDLEFRPGTSMIVPYMKVPILDDATANIKHVIIGPTPHSALSKRSVVSLLQKNGHFGFKVEVSNSPYRTW